MYIWCIKIGILVLILMQEKIVQEFNEPIDGSQSGGKGMLDRCISIPKRRRVYVHVHTAYCTTWMDGTVSGFETALHVF
jgi:hypothetical protein